MIQTIKRTARFKKEYRNAVNRGEDITVFEFILNELVNERVLPAKYQDHALTGNYLGFRECHLRPDWLLVYLIEKDTLTLTLSRMGSHSDLNF